MILPRVVPLAVLFAAAAAVGCGGGEGVKSYTVPRQAEPTTKAAGDYRLLGAMIPAENPVWFFKLSGSADALTKYEGGFDQLLAGTKFKGEAVPPDFTPPEGWKVGPGRAGIVAHGLTADVERHAAACGGQALLLQLGLLHQPVRDAPVKRDMRSAALEAAGP